MSANAFYPRALAQIIEQDLDLYPTITVMGARQVGKSTLCREIAEARGFSMLTLDDNAVRRQAREDPLGLLDAAADRGAYIDEVQRAPELLLALKAVVDRDRRPGRYLLSGSNQPQLRGAVGDSLLGRTAYRTLRPLTLSEMRFTEQLPGWSFLFQDDETSMRHELDRRAELNGANDWRSAVTTGGFPTATQLPANQRRRLLDDYIAVFTSRDVREVLHVESTERFESFLRLAAARTGQILNVSDMAKDLGAKVTTLRRWLDALLRSHLVELLPPYLRNTAQRIIKAPKLILVDSALALVAAREVEPTGFHLETLIASDLLVWRDHAPGRALYHWRTQSQQEVDFIAEEGGRLLPIEIKTSSSVATSDARHLRTFREHHPAAVRGMLLSTDPRIRSLAPGIIAAPWWSVV